MEQHAVLTPELLGEIIKSDVSETTGQLSAPLVRWVYEKEILIHLFQLIGQD